MTALLVYLAAATLTVVLFGAAAHFGGECDHKEKEPGGNPALVSTPSSEGRSKSTCQV